MAKLEFFNPCGSVKDRIGVSMLEAAEREAHPPRPHHHRRADQRQYRHRPGWVCAAKGYRLMMTMPDTMSAERRRLLQALGATLVLTPGSRA